MNKPNLVSHLVMTSCIYFLSGCSPKETLHLVNHAPLAEHQMVELLGNATAAITLTGSDPDNDPIRYKLVTEPTFGALTGEFPEPGRVPP